MKPELKNQFEWLGEWRNENGSPIPHVIFGGGDFAAIGSMGTTGVVRTDEGLVIFDLPIREQGLKAFKRVRDFSDKPVKYIIYSHGHFDHCFGYKPFIEECKEKGWDFPEVIAHENLIPRFEKYEMLDEYHDWINSMQFSSIVKKSGVNAHKNLKPTILMRDQYRFTLGQYTFELFHDKGETDDSIWLWIPERKVIFAGDLVQISYPNVGNPYKVQRYPKHWALAMERMLEKNPNYLVLGHGRPILEKEKVIDILSITAEAMHFVHDEVVKRLNQGKWFEEIYHEMLDIYPEKFENHPYLKPLYGCYRFAIHATYRLYHGWYDTGNPTNLFPSRSSEIAKELLKIASQEKYLEHAKQLHGEGKLQLAIHILDVIINAGQESCDETTFRDTLQLKQRILKRKAEEEPSLIATNIINNEANRLKHHLKEMAKKEKNESASNDKQEL